MTVALEQIQAALAVLQQAISEVAESLRTLYANYLNTLGRAVRQQLILACYHLCTQTYPTAFLQLSLSQRQQLQQDLQDLGQQVEQSCPEFMQLLPTQLSTIATEELSQALEQIEAAIAAELTTLSQQANHLLQTYQVLPQGEVDLLMKVAAKAEATTGPITAGPPNILSALIEKGEADQTEETAITAVYLRLSEIEFADSPTQSWRNQLRKQSSQFVELKRKFALKQRERTVAEAEAAWRASWSEQRPF